MKDKRRKFQWDFWKIVTLCACLLFLVFLVYPLGSMFITGFRNVETGKLTLANFAKFFSKSYYYRTLFNSFKVTICVSVLAILLGTPMAYLMTTVKIRAKGLIQILIIISMLSPPFIGAYSWVVLLGRSGFITKLLEGANIHISPIYGFKGILLVFTLKLFPFMYMYVSGALKKIDVSLSEAAESLGCSNLRKIVTIILPLILPTMAAGTLMVFSNALADFGTPMLIGEGYSVMPTMIYSEFINEMGGSANFAAAMSLMMVFITFILFAAQNYIVGKKTYTMSSLRPIQAKKLSGIKNILAHGFVYIVTLCAVIPQITVIITSFRNTKGLIFVDGYSLNNYKNAISRLGRSILNTYTYALIAIAIIIVLGLLIGYVSVRRKNKLTAALDTVTMLPYIIPGSVLGITLLLAFNSPPLAISGTAAIIILILVVRRLPYTVRSSSAILYQISPSLEEASISLGYTPMQTFAKVTARMMMPGVISGAILSWITIISELSGSIILYTGKTKTLSVAIYTEVSRGNYGNGAALSAILTLTTVISLLIFFRVSGKQEISM